MQVLSHLIATECHHLIDLYDNSYKAACLLSESFIKSTGRGGVAKVKGEGRIDCDLVKAVVDFVMWCWGRVLQLILA